MVTAFRNRSNVYVVNKKDETSKKRRGGGKLICSPSGGTLLIEVIKIDGVEDVGGSRGNAGAGSGGKNTD